MFVPREEYFLGQLFLSLGSPGGTLILNSNVSRSLRFQRKREKNRCLFRVIIWLKCFRVIWVEICLSIVVIRRRRRRNYSMSLPVFAKEMCFFSFVISINWILHRDLCLFNFRLFSVNRSWRKNLHSLVNLVRLQSLIWMKSILSSVFHPRHVTSVRSYPVISSLIIVWSLCPNLTWVKFFSLISFNRESAMRNN